MERSECYTAPCKNGVEQESKPVVEPDLPADLGRALPAQRHLLDQSADFGSDSWSQREMESCRSPLASIQPFRRSSLDDTPNVVAGGQGALLNLQLVSKENQRAGPPIHTPLPV